MQNFSKVFRQIPVLIVVICLALTMDVQLVLASELNIWPGVACRFSHDSPVSNMDYSGGKIVNNNTGSSWAYITCPIQNALFETATINVDVYVGKANSTIQCYGHERNAQGTLLQSDVDTTPQTVGYHRLTLDIDLNDIESFYYVHCMVPGGGSGIVKYSLY